MLSDKVIMANEEFLNHFSEEELINTLQDYMIRVLVKKKMEKPFNNVSTMYEELSLKTREELEDIFHSNLQSNK